VVGAVRTSLTEEPGRMVYFPDWEEADQDMSVVVRTATEPESLSSAIRTAIHHLEPQAAIPSIETMRHVVENSLAAKRFQLILLVSFAAVALMLACLGTYGVLAFAMNRRTFEIGIRLAVGAVPKQILAATLGKGLAPVFIGIAGGLFASACLSRVLQTLLFQVHPLDPMIYFVTPIILLFVAAVACFVPARHAANLNPVEALRHE
jgi:putative ABC transport system permease protein